MLESLVVGVPTSVACVASCWVMEAWSVKVQYCAMEVRGELEEKREMKRVIVEKEEKGRKEKKEREGV